MQDKRIIVLVFIGVAVVVVGFTITLFLSSTAATLIGGGVVTAVTLASSIVLLGFSRKQAAYREETHSAQQISRTHKQQITRFAAVSALFAGESDSSPEAWEDEAAQEMVRRARRIQQYANTYREKLGADPAMAQLKILTMTWPLSLVQMYVQLRLHHQTRPENLPPLILNAQSTYDPNLILRADRLHLESRASVAINPANAIRLYQRCIILGDPGMGKTTLLKYLALRCAKQDLPGLSDLPIHIDLNMFAQSDQQNTSPSIDSSDRDGEDQPNPLLLFAAAHWEQYYDFPAQEALSYMQKNLENGNALVLLDGLDETAVGGDPAQAEKNYERVASLIRRMTRTYRNAFIVVTARIAGYQQRVSLPDFTELEVLGFREPDVEQFVNNWFEYRPRLQLAEGSGENETCTETDEVGDPHVLNARLRNPRLQTLASSPLLLALIVTIYQQKGTPPDRRADLYRDCVRLLLEEWDRDLSHNKKRSRSRIFSPEHKEHLLKEVAWHFHKQGLRYFPESALYQVIADFLISIGQEGKEKEALEEISINTGLLKEQAKGWYGFLHLTLQEYFAALAILEDQKRYAELLDHLRDSRWEEVILLYAGHVADASPLLESLLQMDRHNSRKRAIDTLFYDRLILAGRCLATGPIIRRKELRYKIIQRLFQELKCTPYTLARQQLAETLAENGHAGMYADPGTGPVPAVKDEGYQLEQSVNDHLFSLLTGEEEADLKIQLSIARALGMYGDETVARKLAELLSNEWIDAEVRMSIARVLGLSGAQRLAHDMAKILSNLLINCDVRLSVAVALRELLDDALIPYLIELVRNPGVDPEVRCAIVDAIGFSGKRSGVSDLRELRKRELPQSRLYRHSIVALAALGESSDLVTLVPLLEEAYEVDARREIAHALGTLRLPWLVPELLPLLWKKQIPVGVRLAIVSALEAIGDRSILPELVEKLTDKEIEEHIRAAIGALLGSLGDQRLIAPLKRLKFEQAEKDPVYRSVIIALGRLGDETVSKFLLNWLEDEALEVGERLNVVDALGYLLNALDTTAREDLLRIAASQLTCKEIRSAVIALLPRLVYIVHSDPFNRRIIDTLNPLVANIQSDQSIFDDAHRALWSARSSLVSLSDKLHFTRD